MAEYRRKLAEYTAIRQAFDEEAGAYWSAISEKRKVRNAKRRSGETIALDDYVLTQPPIYSGPPKPIDPSAPPTPPSVRKPLPVVADFLQNALDHFQFTPRKPANEIDFKRAYARVASSLGLTKDQAVRVYSFEAGGNGKYDVQAGLEKPGGRAISTALGYNQLLTTNTIDLLSEHGGLILKSLRDQLQQATGPRKAELEAQDCHRPADGQLLQNGAQRMERPRKARRHATRHRCACPQSGYGRRADPADHEADGLGQFCAAQGIHDATLCARNWR